MAKNKLPDPLERRHLIERELPAEQAGRLAEAYLEAGRVWEAIDFLTKAGQREKLVEVQERAIEQGDAFLLREASRALEAAPAREQWRALARAAEAAGKQQYATEALRQAQGAEG